jgi:hypothetical protein
MTTFPQPLRFGQHSLAVLGAAMLGSTIFALISTAAIAVLARAPMSVSWFAVIALACWFTVFLFALPGAAIVFSLLWPATRQGTAAGAWICVIAGAALGIVLAPFGTSNGATWMQMALPGLTGAVIGVLYVALARRMARGPNPRRVLPGTFRHRLPPVTPEAPVQA